MGDVHRPVEVSGMGDWSPDLAESHHALAPHAKAKVSSFPVEHTTDEAHNFLSNGAKSGPTIDTVGSPGPRRTALAYIYCNSQSFQGSERTRTGHSVDPAAGYDTTGLLSSLLRQLYQFLPKDQDIPAVSDLCFETREDHPSREDITKGIKSAIALFNQAFIVVDGLDECSGLESIEFESFCTFLSGLAKSDGTRPATSILIFSRPGYPAINKATLGCPRIEVDQGANAEDIRLFISDRSRALTKDSESLKEIQDHLQDSADGMFLWVSLTIDSIKKERTPKKMKTAAKNVPKDLFGAYVEALMRVIRKETSIRDLALKALLWAANSKKPLSEAQLLEALAIEPGMTSISDDEKLDGAQLTTDCADLLVLRDGNYALLHASLGEFLRSLPDIDLEGLLVYRELQNRASRILVEDCITYIKFAAFETGPRSTKESFDEMLEHHPFMEYAGIFWGDHLREALEGNDPELKRLARDLLRTQSSREILHQIHLAKHLSYERFIYPFPFPPGTTPLHLLSIFGLQSMLDAFSPAELDIEQADGLGYYGIDYAVWNSRQEMCSWIVAEQTSRSPVSNLEKGISCCSERWLMDTIVRNQWTDILSSLLRLGYPAANADLGGKRALHLAANLGYVDVVELLLDSGADPNMRDANGKTPLIAAAVSEHIDVMRVLLRHSADVSCQEWDGKTALHQVAFSDNPEMVAALAGQGACVQARWWESTPLHVAAFSGHGRVIDSLIAFGATTEAGTKIGYTPLIVAAKKGRSDAVRALLRNGADVAATGHNLATALHCAAVGDYVEIVSILLKAPLGRSIIDQRNKEGNTPLWLAVCYGKTASAIELLENGAQVDLEGDKGRTPALIALGKGHTSLASMLFDGYDADPNHLDNNGATSLHMAAMSGRPEHIQKLLSCGVDAAIRDSFGHSALYYAVESRLIEFVKSFTKIVSAKGMFEGDDELLGEFSRISAYFCHSSSWVAQLLEDRAFYKSCNNFPPNKSHNSTSANIDSSM